MTFEVIFVISQSLNFLGFAREKVLQKRDYSFLWSRDTEILFASDDPVDVLLSRIPLHVREVLQEYKDPFLEEWPSFYGELVQVENQLKMLWDSNSRRVATLMEGLGFFYRDVIEVFPVMPFFREWPRSNPLSMPVMPWTDKEVLTFLIHEILHRTTDIYHPYSLWYYLSIVFFMKKIPHERKFLVQHALIYIAASWIASHALEEEFEMPKIEQKTSRKEQYIEMKRYIYSLFTFFSSIKEENKNLMDLAEKIAAHCNL